MIDILFKFKKDDYVIEIEKSKSLLYEFLYNLSQIKLSKLRRYFENTFYKE